MKKTLVIISFLFVTIYLLIGRSLWFSELENQMAIAKSYIYSDQIDLGKKSTFTWKIPASQWKHFDGKAKLFLVLNRTSESVGKDYWDKDFDLRVALNVYAITENKIKSERLITNYFFPTNEPIKDDAKIWKGWGDEKAQYLLGSLMRFVKEDTYVELVVTTPDLVLAKTEAKLKIVGDYDPAIFGHYPFIKLLRDIGLLICIVLFGWISILAIKKETS